MVSTTAYFHFEALHLFIFSFSGALFLVFLVHYRIYFTFGYRKYVSNVTNRLWSLPQSTEKPDLMPPASPQVPLLQMVQFEILHLLPSMLAMA